MAICKLLAILALTFVFNNEIVSAATNKVICYHGSWSTYRHGNGLFKVEDIDPTLCTHLIYTFLGVNTDGSVKILDPYLEVDNGNFKRFNALKLKNPKLKTLVAIGGWGEGSAKYSAVAADPQKRATLIKSALSLVQTYGFDGFDLDWEYPGQRDGNPSIDKANFATLIKEFRAEWDKHGLLLTAAVAASASSVDKSYDVPALSKYLDFINVMAYDLHGSYDGVTGQNAPLYASSIDVSAEAKLLNVDSAIRGWIERGADPQRIALGLGVYGRSYTLASASQNKLGAAVVNAGNSGKFTQEPGMLGYNEICESQLDGGWTTVWDDEQKNPYTYKGNQWVGYDDPKSIAIKVEYAKSLNLGAVMIWSIETEDFKGECGPKYPILNAINSALDGTSNEDAGSGGASSSAPSGSSSSAASSSTAAPGGSTSAASRPADVSTLCKKAGYIRDPVDCSIFYYCLPVNGAFAALEQKCNHGLIFDVASNVCNYPDLVKCP